MYREISDADKVRALMRLLGERAKGPGRIYLVGGASAVLIGWRETTVDVDLKLAPEPNGVFVVIADAKAMLNINVELAAPDDFIPPLPGWEGRSRYIIRHGLVEFFHYDFYAQALAKIERPRVGLARRGSNGQAEADRARALDGALPSHQARLVRHPALDPASFRARVRQVTEQ